MADAREGDLKRLKGVALLLLVIMGALFVLGTVLRHANPVFGYIQALGEAGLAGGLADWFAITALFRRPLGLPIPHTAILPRSRARIARALGDFVARSILTEPLIEKALAQFSAARTLGEMLDGDALEKVASGLDLQASPLAGAALQAFWTPDRSRRLADSLTRLARDLMTERREDLKDALAAHGRTWSLKWLDRLLAGRVVEALEGMLVDLESPDHPWREAIDRTVRTYAEKLVSGEEGLPSGGSLSGDESRDLFLRAARALADDIRTQPQRYHALDQAVREGLTQRLLDARESLGDLTTEQVMSWSEADLVSAVETQTGADLQYIRINGALVGALVGLVLHAGARLIGG